ncbi:ABC transporter-like, ATP-binding domain [Dillenia turbinata]|uniref:ABC transporter-like, ATP-binding domain n=1 Tax=Dillenia turbinata TaxID=194707 RepID=A0AAN8V2W4_9MAGN
MGSKGGLFHYADGVDKLVMLLGTLGGIGDGLMTPLTMFVLSEVINEYGEAMDSFSNQIVNKYALRLLYVAILVGLSAFTEGICWTRTAERQTSRMRMEYLKSVLRQEVGFFDSQAGSSTFQVVSTISSDALLIQDVIAEKIPNCLSHFTAFIASIVVAFILSWHMALSALPFTLMFVAPGIGFGKVLMGLGAKMKIAYGAAGGVAEQALSSIRTIYSYVGEHQTVSRFSDALEKSTDLGIKLGFTRGLLMGSMGMIYAAWALESWVGSILVTEKGEKSGPVFIGGVCVVLGGLSVISALPNISFITEAKTAAAQIFEITNRIPIIDSEDSKGKILNHVRGKIEFKKVSFSYPTRPDTLILQRFSLTIEAGKTIGLVGSSGSGKSTIISLLQRFYDPIEGDIFLDGTKIKKLQLQSLRCQMGLVSQEPVLFATSIMENILFGNEEADMDLVMRAAKVAHAHDFITSLPDGYETQVGQFGFQLSGGQKQRIAIARAMVREPRILLLDEATSALDAQSERVVQEALDMASQGRTAIVIAHRLTTIRNADLIVVLQSGKVVESGNHDELMQMTNGEGGAYRQMMQLQQSAVQNETYNYSNHHPTGSGNHRNIREQTPCTPLSERSSNKSSPLNYFSPAFSISMVNSFQEDLNDDRDNQDSSKSSYPPPSLWRLVQFNAPEWKNALVGCLAAAGSGAIQPVNSYCLGSVIAIFFLDSNSKIKSETKFFCFIFIILAVLFFITSLLQHYNFAIMGERLTKRVRQKVLEKVLTFEIGWFDRNENTSAAICARLATEASMVRSLVGDRMSLLVQVFASASLAFVLGLVVTWRLSLVMIAMQPFLIASYYSKSVLMKSLSLEARKAQNEGSQLASEAIVNHRTITAFSSQKRVLSLFQATMRGPRKESIKHSWFSGLGLLISQFLTTASIALTYWYGGRLMSHGLITSKHLFQAFFILMSTAKNIADAGSMTSDLAKSSKAIGSIFAILDRKSEIEPEDPKTINVEKGIKGRIDLKSVFFAYPSRPDQMIFQGLTLKIEAGKTVALVGQSGSGKSTVIGLVERFYDPVHGSVMIDRLDVKNYNLRHLRSHIALVSQEPTLFAGTIRQNIVYGREDATEAEVRKAARLANAHEFISSMEDGYETFCGERGVQLSGGQKQRIALARAILKNPAILLLDEATSALDSVSENLVQEALEKMMVGRTCVVVAHRVATIQKSDSIAVIKNGKVVEQGSHSELLAIGNRGSYYSLIKLRGDHSPYRDAVTPHQPPKPPSFRHLHTDTSSSSASTSTSTSREASSSSIQSNHSLQTLPSVPSLNLDSLNHLCLSLPPLSHLTLSLPNTSHSHVTSLSISNHLLYAAVGYQVNVYDLTNFSLIDSFNSENPSSGSIKSVIFSNGRVFTAHQDCKIRVWQATTSKRHRLVATLPTVNDILRRFILPKNYFNVRRHKKRLWIEHNDAISCLAAVNNGQICSVSWDNHIKIWNSKNLRCLESFKAHHDAVNAVAISADGTIYTGSADRTIRVWTKQEGESRHSLLATLERHKSAVNALALTSDGSVLFSGACDRSILVWEGEDSANHMVVTGALRGHSRAILSLINVCDLLFSGSADQTVRIWRCGVDGKYCCLGVLDGHRRPVKSLVAVMNGESGSGGYEILVCSGSFDGEIKVRKVSVSDLRNSSYQNNLLR